MADGGRGKGRGAVEALVRESRDYVSERLRSRSKSSGPVVGVRYEVPRANR